MAICPLVAEVRTPEAYFAAIRTYEVLGDPASAREIRAELKHRFPRARERKDSAGG